MFHFDSRLREKIRSRLYAASSHLFTSLKPLIRQPPKRLLFFFFPLSILLFIFLYLTFSLSPSPSHPLTSIQQTTDDLPDQQIFANLSQSSQPPSTTSKPHVIIWHSPASCNAPFRTGPARDSQTNFPYAVLRDAVVDRRPISTTELGQQDSPGTVRIVLYFTTHLSARLTREHALVNIEGSDLIADVEYVNHITTFLIPRIPGRPPGSYRPGLKTNFGREVTEWQAGLRLQPRDPRQQNALSAVADAVAENRDMNITISVIRFDETVFPLNIRMGLACVLGWIPLGLEEREPGCGHKGEDAKGAVVISGSALYGKKKLDPLHYPEVANFAARALMGPLTYDMVAMSVVVLHSGADIEFACRQQGQSCRERLEKENAKHLVDIAKVVEESLDQIGVPRELFSRLLLIPSCRLGSDAEDSEEGDPCFKSKRFGQYYASFFTYTMLSSFFKWASCHDMDEYFAPAVPPLKLQPQPGRADEVLDYVDLLVGGSEGHFVFQWLNFRVKSPEDSRALSAGLIKGQRAVLSNRANVSASDRCYYKLGDNTGKSAMRCDIGFGFSIHHPVIVSRGSGHKAFIQGNRMYYGLRTWHARFGRSKGTCDFAPTK